MSEAVAVFQVSAGVLLALISQPELSPEFRLPRVT